MTERREKLQPHPGALINRGCSRFPSSSDPASGLPASAQHTDHRLFSNPLETENRAPTVTRLICREWRCLTLTDHMCHQCRIKSGSLKSGWFVHNCFLNHMSLQQADEGGFHMVIVPGAWKVTKVQYY